MAYDNLEHAFKKFSSDLRDDNFNNVILICGEEDYLIKWAIDSLINKYINPSAINIDLVKLNQESSIDEIIEACETFSMFLGKRIIIVDDFLPLESDKGAVDVSRLVEYIKNINNESILIFKSKDVNEKNSFYNYIKEVGSIYNFTKLDEITLQSFVSKEFKKNGIVLDKSLIKYFIDQTGYFNREGDYRIFDIVNDIIKIVALSNNNQITKNDIDNIVIGDADTFAFNFIDAISNNKKELAFEMLENIIKDTDVYQITGLLINQFELNLEVLEFKSKGMNLSQIVNTLKIHEFRVKKALATADQFGINKIKEILSKLYEVDRNIKMGVMDGRTSLEIILSQI